MSAQQDGFITFESQEALQRWYSDMESTVTGPDGKEYRIVNRVMWPGRFNMQLICDLEEIIREVPDTI